MALTQISTNGIKNGTITGTDLATNVDLVDNQKIRLGTSNDLQIYHDGTVNRFISSGSGAISFQSGGGNFLFRKGTSEALLKLIPDAAVELYYDNSKKFETTSIGAAVNGALEVNGTGTLNNDELQFSFSAPEGHIKVKNSSGSPASNLKLHTTDTSGTLNNLLKLSYDKKVQIPLDNAKLQIGASQDLEIYHTGSAGNIINTTGLLKISASAGSTYVQSDNNVWITKNNNAETMAKFSADGAVELYYDNSKKFETTSTGVTVTGNITAGALLSSNASGQAGLSFGDGVQIQLGASQDLQIFHDGTGCNIRSTSSKLEIRSPDLILQNSAAEKYFRGISDGAVELYYDNSKKFETTSGGVSVTGTVTSSSHIISGGMVDISDNNQLRLGDDQDMMISHDGTSGAIRNATGELYVRSDGVRLVNNGNSETFLVCNNNGAVELYHNNSKKFETTSSGATVTGTLSATNTNITTQMYMPDNGQIRLGNSDDLKLYHDGNHSRISDEGSGSLLIQSNGGNIQLNKGTTENMLIANVDGAVELYYDNSLKLKTTSSGINVDGRVTTDELSVIKASGNLSANFEAQSGLGTLEIGGSTGAFIDLKTPFSDDFDLRINSDGVLTSGGNIHLNVQGNETGLRVLANGACELYHDNSRKFHTTSTGGRITGGIIINGGHNWFIVDAGSGSCDTYRATTAGGIIHFFSNVGGTRTMKSYINESGSLVSASDYRLKTDIAEVTNGISIVKDLKPSTYKWKHDSTTTHHGFIAHELQTVLPNCVDGDKDDVKTDGTTPKYQFYSDKELVPVLTAALKEAIAKIETLETKVAALEAA